MTNRIGLLVCLGFSALASAQTLHTRPTSAPIASASIAAQPQTAPPSPAAIAKGTYLTVAATRTFPMKIGTPIEARLLAPIYVNNALVLPQGTLLRGNITALTPDKQARIWARLNGDFTPIDQPMVRFDSIETSGGTIAIYGDAAQAGLPMVSLKAQSGSRRHALIVQAWNGLRQKASDTKNYFTSPGLGNRLKIALYQQLPYHPQQINAGASWSFPLSDALAVSTLEATGQPSLYAPPQKKHKARPAKPPKKTTPAPAASKRPHWLIHAELETPLTSRTAKPGDPIVARVVQPVFDTQKHITIPQGATLVGHVTIGKAARSFGRAGHLRFSFQSLKMPAGATQNVQGSVTGAMASGGKSMNMDAEGNVSGKNNGSIAPIVLGLLAEPALGTDGNTTAVTGGASNGFGAAGRIAGIMAGSRSLAAGIGFYAVGLSISSTWLRKGHEIAFPQGTRIDIDTAPLTEPVLTPQLAASPRSADLSVPK